MQNGKLSDTLQNLHLKKTVEYELERYDNKQHGTGNNAWNCKKYIVYTDYHLHEFNLMVSQVINYLELVSEIRHHVNAGNKMENKNEEQKALFTL